MAALSSILLGVGTAVSVYGAVSSASAQKRMAEEQAAANKQGENVRRQQMELDAGRRRRQAVRESLLARAQAQTVGTAQGASDSSGVAGAMAQATATGLQNQNTATQAEILGGRIFDVNARFADATLRGQQAMATGSMISSLGGAIASNAQTFGRLGTYFTTPSYG